MGECVADCSYQIQILPCLRAENAQSVRDNDFVCKGPAKSVIFEKLLAPLRRNRKWTLADRATVRRIFYRPNPPRSDILPYFGIFLDIYNSVEDVTKVWIQSLSRKQSWVPHVQAWSLV
jgi:hypothetical protein